MVSRGGAPPTRDLLYGDAWLLHWTDIVIASMTVEDIGRYVPASVSGIAMWSGESEGKALSRAMEWCGASNLSFLEDCLLRASHQCLSSQRAGSCDQGSEPSMSTATDSGCFLVRKMSMIVVAFKMKLFPNWPKKSNCRIVKAQIKRRLAAAK